MKHYTLFLLIFIILNSCNKKEQEISDSYDSYKCIIHKNSMLKDPKIRPFKNYLTIAAGNNVVYEYTHNHENVKGALDSGSWNRLFFYFNADSAKVGKTYYFQNEDQIKTYAFIGGGFIGIQKLYGIRGSFTLLAKNNNFLKIKIKGAIKADKIEKDSVYERVILSDTTLVFKPKA